MDTNKKIEIPTRFTEREDVRGWMLVVSNLFVVVAAGSIAWHIGELWAFVIAFILVGARGQACYILQHETMHNLLFNSPKTNVRVGMVLSAALGTQFYIGRKMHWDHHRHVGQGDDPNDVFHNVENRPPGLAVMRFFAFHLFGGRLLMLFRNLAMAVLGMAGFGKSDAAARPIIPASKARADLMALVTVQLFLLIVISAASSPWVYVVLYVLPLSTLTALFEALRSFSEHVLPGQPTSEVEEERRFFMDCGPVERFFISQFDFHFHHVHHLYPNVVTFKVRELHHWLCRNDPDFETRYETRPGYVETALRYLLNKPFPGAGRGYPADTLSVSSHAI